MVVCYGYKHKHRTRIQHDMDIAICRFLKKQDTNTLGIHFFLFSFLEYMLYIDIFNTSTLALEELEDVGLSWLEENVLIMVYK